MTLTGHTTNRVALYARESPIELVPGTSMNQQMRRLSDYCTEHGLKVVRTYLEVGFTSDQNRPVFDQLLSDVTRPDFESLLCCSIDRLTRSLSDIGMLIQVLDDSGITIVQICTPDAGSVHTRMRSLVGIEDRARDIRACQNRSPLSSR